MSASVLDGDSPCTLELSGLERDEVCGRCGAMASDHPAHSSYVADLGTVEVPVNVLSAMQDVTLAAIALYMVTDGFDPRLATFSSALAEELGASGDECAEALRKMVRLFTDEKIQSSYRNFLASR